MTKCNNSLDIVLKEKERRGTGDGSETLRCIAQGKKNAARFLSGAPLTAFSALASPYDFPPLSLFPFAPTPQAIEYVTLTHW